MRVVLRKAELEVFGSDQDGTRSDSDDDSSTDEQSASAVDCKPVLYSPRQAIHRHEVKIGGRRASHTHDGTFVTRSFGSCATGQADDCCAGL